MNSCENRMRVGYRWNTSNARIALLCFACALSLPVGTVWGTEFQGSDPLGSAGLTVGPGINLLNTDEFSVSHVFANPGTDDFSDVPYFTSAGPATWIIDLSDLSNLSFGSLDFGTFTAASGTIISRTESFVNVYVSGYFDNTTATGVPYTNLTSASGDLANLHFALSQTGQAISWGGTLNVESGVPEPASGLLALLGIFGFSMGFRRTTASA